jgi:hypothetical protein
VQRQPDGIFDSIESAHEYITLLIEIVGDVRRDLENDLASVDSSQFPRRVDAIRLASYHLDKLQLHMSASARILNDLRSIRRLLFEERQTRVDTETHRSL